MNNLIFGNQDRQKIGAAVEEKVRKETGAAGPIAYSVEDGGLGATSAATVLVDIGKALGGGSASTLFTLVFPLPGAQGATLTARIDRQGVGAHIGSLLYSAALAKPVAGEVAIEDHKTFGTPKFLGDPAAAARLNGVKDLAKRVDKLARTETEMGTITVKAPRLFKIAPKADGSVLALNTLPRMTSMGMGAEVDAREFLDIARAIDAAL